MELQEHGHQNSDRHVEHVSNLDHNILHQQLLVLFPTTTIVGIDAPLDGLKPGEAHSDGDEISDNEDVNEQEDEELAIPESNAVVDPGAVMVHVEHTAIAG